MGTIMLAMCSRRELAAIISRDAYEAHPEWRDLGALLVTDDTLRCYGDIAAAWRRERASASGCNYWFEWKDKSQGTYFGRPFWSRCGS